MHSAHAKNTQLAFEYTEDTHWFGSMPCRLRTVVLDEMEKRHRIDPRGNDAAEAECTRFVGGGTNRTAPGVLIQRMIQRTGGVPGGGDQP